MTPRELGEQVGAGWARLMRDNRQAMKEGDRLVDPVAVVAGDPPRIPRAVRKLVMKAGTRRELARSGDPNAESKFWDGFIAGVRSYLALPSLGMGNN